MNELISIEELIEVLTYLNDEELMEVRKAYKIANELHAGKFRQSGEPYICHPLMVAFILAEFHVDKDTICAAILHDTIEDTPITQEEITRLFNEDVSLLVDGVTKISQMNFSTKQDQNMANIRKILMAMAKDVRVILIKLADRLHNMRTLQFKSEFKQKENSLETMEIFVPLAYCIGAYRIKSELEDLSLRYLEVDKYRYYEEIKLKTEEESHSCLTEMLLTLDEMLNEQNFVHEIKVRTKNVYGIYKRIEEQGHQLVDIHDLLSLKVMVQDIPNCYLTLGMIHSKYHPLHHKFKDYIYNPKTNMYQSLHTTIFGEEDRLVQTQIRTFEMDQVASFGLAAYWSLHQENARVKMQEEFKKYQFYKSLVEIDEMFADNQEFVARIKDELLTAKVYVYTIDGKVVELPVGSTPVDFAYYINDHLWNTMIGATVNDQEVPFDYQLKTQDRVRIFTDEYLSASEILLDKARTTHAKMKIKENIAHYS